MLRNHIVVGREPFWKWLGMTTGLIFFYSEALFTGGGASDPESLCQLTWPDLGRCRGRTNECWTSGTEGGKCSMITDMGCVWSHLLLIYPRGGQSGDSCGKDACVQATGAREAGWSCGTILITFLLNPPLLPDGIRIFIPLLQRASLAHPHPAQAASGSQALQEALRLTTETNGRHLLGTLRKMPFSPAAVLHLILLPQYLKMQVSSLLYGTQRSCGRRRNGAWVVQAWKGFSLNSKHPISPHHHGEDRTCLHYLNSISTHCSSSGKG